MEKEDLWKTICVARVSDYALPDNIRVIERFINLSPQKGNIMLQFMLQRLEKLIRVEVIPQFYQKLEVCKETLSFSSMQDAICFIENTCAYYCQVLRCIPMDEGLVAISLAKLKDLIRTSLVNENFGLFCNTMEIYLNTMYHWTSIRKHGYSTGDVQNHQMESTILKVQEDDYVDGAINILGQALSTLEWFDLTEDIVLGMIHTRVQHRITSLCGAQFDQSYLERLIEWVTCEIMPWIKTLIKRECKVNEIARRWEAGIQCYVYDRFANLRISELFDIIIEFPDSTCAVVDLRNCLDHTLQHRELIVSLTQAIRKRLLHPGANTSQIIDIYILAIKSMRLLDSSGVILEGISEPIKEYLRQRPDTVYCVVKSLTDDKSSELYEELGRGNLKLIQQDDQSDDDECFPVENELVGKAVHVWNPDPIHADPMISSKSRACTDLLSILVSIYGSKEVFVHEYRLMLAQKLIGRQNYDTDDEVCTHEFLKLRFGETCLQQCEIMMKDVDDSRRTNINILAERKKRLDNGIANANLFPIDALIISSQYWPISNEESFELHPIVKAFVADYRSAFAFLKAPRSLEWIPNVGAVTLNIELDGGFTKTFEVSPIQATIIMHFEDQPRWDHSHLASKMLVSSDFLERNIVYWVRCKIVEVVQGNMYQILNNQSKLSHQDSFDTYFDDELEAEPLSANKWPNEKQQKILQAYLLGMLANFGTLTLSRIHHMLITFSQSDSSEAMIYRNVNEIKRFLDRMISEEKIECSSGHYQLHHARTMS